MTDRDVYLLFSEQFRLIDDNLDNLVKRAEDFAQAQQIVDAWKQSNLNYLRARNKLFSDHAAAIGQLAKEFEQANKSIKRALDELKKGAATIKQIAGIISAAVGKGTKLQEAA